jgi:hypothetical protein
MSSKNPDIQLLSEVLITPEKTISKLEDPKVTVQDSLFLELLMNEIHHYCTNTTPTYKRKPNRSHLCYTAR